jgi:iron complex outermembrane receptor protein
MKHVLTFISLLFATAIFAQSSVTGTVTDASNGEPLIGATVIIKNERKGTATNYDGQYSLSVENGTYTLVVSYVGYAEQEKEVSVSDNLTADFALELSGITGTEVVISGSRKQEKLTESPATIETIHARELQEFSGNPGELLARLKGVEYVRAGVAGPGINIRGFNSNFNSKNLQVSDGRISTLIATGLPLGPLNTVVKEDIERIEVILGPNSTLYGPNAHNGLLNTITKDPRRHQGTDITIGAGNQSLLTARLRHAQVINEKFAYKVTAEYTQAEEFEYSDSVYIDRVGAFDTLGNPIRDGIKEGYEEFQLDRGINFFRAEGQLIYTINDKSDLTFATGYSNSTYLAPTNVGRNQIKDWSINYYQLKYSTKNFFVQAYYTQSATDSTYSIDDRTKRYYSGIDAGLSPEVAAGGYSYQSGALFQDASRRFNTEAQYNETFGKLEVIAGVQFQSDQANSLGTYLLDTSATDYITVNQLGGYVHLKYDFGKGFRAVAAARADNHQIYGFNFVPKFALLKIWDKGTLRLTYGEGIAAPTILNMYGNLFGGLILGNAEGFTLADGTKIEKQRVERLKTIEMGYRGQIVKSKFFIDANVYYNMSQDFLSPVTFVGVTTERGETPIEEVQAAYATYGGLVATYINFGKFNTYGADLSATYYFTPEFSGTLNYSHFNYSIDENNTADNDFNGDGVVNFLDLLVNAPNNRFGFGLNYSGKKFFANTYIRWVQEYDYFSSFQIASKTHEDLSYRGTPIVEDARSTDSYNYGPLGGFTTVDFGLGYRINDMFTIAANVTNVFNTEMREFTAAPPTGRLFSIEFRTHLPAIKK